MLHYSLFHGLRRSIWISVRTSNGFLKKKHHFNINVCPKIKNAEQKSPPEVMNFVAYHRKMSLDKIPSLSLSLSEFRRTRKCTPESLHPLYLAS